jgi:S-DNA-T family DNA segregation ATPase FtsK/SpoIIIE
MYIMTDVDLNGHKDAGVPPPETFLVPRDTSFEHPLDETAPKPEPVHEGDGNDIPDREGKRRPIVPEHLRTLAGIRSTAGKYLDAARFHALFHALRSPMYLVLSVLWACAGMVKLARAQVSWWWVTEQSFLRSKAVVDGNSPEWRALHSHVIKRRSWRGAVLGAEAFTIVLALVLVAALAPAWAWLIVAAAAMPPLAAYGHPASMPIFRSAVTTPLVRKVSTDVIIRAYEVAGLSSTDPKKPQQHLSFGSTMSRDPLDKGSQVVVYLPYGETFADVVAAKPGIASGLDVSQSQVYFTKDKQSERRHTLRILDEDPLAESAGRTPLLDCKQRSVWHKFPFGLDQFGRRVAFCLMWISLLIGAQPRMGKTFAGRLIALYCALDPYVNITLIDGKSSKDWQPLQLVAHRFIQGTHPNRDGDPVDQAIAALHEIEQHIVHVNDELKKLPTSQCPQGKLTEQLYKRDDLHVWLLIVEEFQAYYELDDKKKAQEIARLLSYIGSQGPSAGVILESLSQKPSGVGGGDAGRMFMTFRDNHRVRFGLRAGNRDVSNAILGNEAYGEGYSCADLPLGDDDSGEYKGIGILYGLHNAAPTVRTYLADGEDAEVICVAARKIRERVGTLSGDAAGLIIELEESDIVADLAGVFGGDPGLWWEVAADRLAGSFPDRYADATGDSVRSSCAKRGISSVDVRMPPGRDGTKKRGVRKADLDGIDRR